MDCGAARVLFAFDRPGGLDLSADDRATLATHLVGCADCRTADASTRQFDAKFGRAMSDVAVPASLIPRLKVKLAAERTTQTIQRAGTGLAAAVALLTLGVGWAHWYNQSKPAADVAAISDQLGDRSAADPKQVAGFFRRAGLPFAEPPRFDFSQLLGYDTGTLNGRPVAKLTFIHYRADRTTSLAEVFVLHDSRFAFRDLGEGGKHRDDASNRTVWLIRPEGQPAFAFAVVLYNNGTLDEFQIPDPAAVGG